MKVCAPMDDATSPYPPARDPEPGTPAYREELERICALALRHGEVVDVTNLGGRRLAEVRAMVLDRIAGPPNLN